MYTIRVIFQNILHYKKIVVSHMTFTIQMTGWAQWTIMADLKWFGILSFFVKKSFENHIENKKYHLKWNNEIINVWKG